jgi:hypothetical protein
MRRANRPWAGFLSVGIKGNSDMEINTKAPKVNRELTVNYDFGNSLEEMTKKFGADVVYSHALDNMVIGLQANIRGKLEKDGEDRMSDQAIRAAIGQWKPGQRKQADPKKKAEVIKTAFAKMDEATRKALLAELRGSMKAS